MTVVLNGDDTQVSDGMVVADLIGFLGLKAERLAIEVNHKIIRRAEWASTPLAEGDRVEIVHFVGGG
ncbi:MAG TPA: sulfur carrier protein ThiS [Blastocatellia bacterium]|nr:sulfur carrier protein ThiS [Blastocatellia bacterium]